MVDVIVATYNGEKYLAVQLDSILNQTYRDIRIILRDDGSTDRTVEIIRDYEKQYPGRVVLVQDDVKCGSARSNFMQALKFSDAPYVAFSDQDDCWLPEKIERSMKRMEELEKEAGKDKPVLVFGSYKPVDAELRPIETSAKGRQEAAYKIQFPTLLVQNYVNGCLMMINRTLADLMGDFDPAILMHDWWAAMIAAGGGKIEHINEVMSLYRQHGNNVVGAVNVKSFRYRLSKFFNSETRDAPGLYLKQAKLLYERNAEALTPQHRAELERFIALYGRSKPVRMKELISGRYLKSDLVRILGQLWYI